MEKINLLGVKVFVKYNKINLIYNYNNQKYLVTSEDGITFSSKPKNLKFSEIFLKINNLFFSEEELVLDIDFKKLFQNKSKKKYYKLPKYKFNGFNIFYYEEGENIRIGYSKQNKKIKPFRLIISPRRTYFDNIKLNIGTIIRNKKEIILIYYTKNDDEYSVGFITFDLKNPTKITNRSKQPIWENKVDENKYKLINIVFFKNNIFIYWNSKNGITVTKIPFNENNYLDIVEKIDSNPIISPTKNNWESTFTLNPAAFEHEGKIHVLYRAIDENWHSVLGHAILNKDKKILYRSTSPIYIHKREKSKKIKNLRSAFVSGNIPLDDIKSCGVSSCEDPRVVKIRDKLYLIYIAFERYPKIAVSDIKLKDFLNKKYIWSKPKIISPKGEVHKNWVLFPEKINNKFAILHSISPSIQIEYVDKLDEKSNIKSKHIKVENKNSWDYLIRGVGPPPLKTEKGWLIFYHAHTKDNLSEYKLGAMLLDLNDPTKIIAKSKSPVIIPEKDYEMFAYKPGIVYSCGAVILENNLYIYYGAADNHVCVAKVELNKFLNELLENKIYNFKNINIKKNGRRRNFN